MKICLIFFLAFSLCTIAAEKYGVYDPLGNRVSTFEAASHELPEKVQLIKAIHPNKSLYISSVQKGKSSKPSSRYRYKTEVGAYIDASRKEMFSVCPDKEIQGTWISEHSVALNAENCISIQAPSLVGAFRILFLQNNGRTDTIQVLVEQSYIQMSDYSHRVWITDLDYEKVTYMGSFLLAPWRSWEDVYSYGRYESKSYTQPLIVDKTKLTMGDALYYYKIDNAVIVHWTFAMEEYKNKNLEESDLPFAGAYSYNAWRLANKRSQREGLDTAYIMDDAGLAVDTSASGYRLPFEDEWMLLMRAGASTRYYWGDKDDLSIVSRYEWVSPIGLKPVAQKLPNGFGLYDMAGIADELVQKYENWGFGVSCRGNLSPECTLVNEIGAREEYIEPSSTVCELTGSGKCTIKKQEVRSKRIYYDSFRFIRKASKLHKLDKF